jgi:hypothetical protein
LFEHVASGGGFACLQGSIFKETFLGVVVTECSLGRVGLGVLEFAKGFVLQVALVQIALGYYVVYVFCLRYIGDIPILAILHNWPLSFGLFRANDYFGLG